ncbi:MAG: TraU family protein [Burkholderiales bacterium]|nr:TraU family protein [Burkholderiales bacterium]
MPSLNAPSSVPVPTTSELMGFLSSAPSSIAGQWRTIPDSYGGGQGATAKAQVKISEILRSVGGPLATLNTGLGKLGRSLPTSGFSGVGIGGGGSSGGAGFGVFCPAGATPFGLYYQSFLDTLTWRDILPLEMLYPASWLPGMREIGSGLTQSWGSVYPRTGSLVQQHPVKGGAVLAQRVADIVGQRNQPHVYRPLDVQPGGWIWFGDQGIRENDNSHTRWQRLYPDAETSCSVFGGDDRFSLTSYGDAHVAASRDVVFNMWRRQECCQRLSGIYLGSISIQ